MSLESKMNGHNFLNISNNWLLHIATHLFTKSVSCRSAKFTIRNFECMVCLKKFTLQEIYIYIYIYIPRLGQVFWVRFFRGFLLTCKIKCQEALGPQGPRISFDRRNRHSIFALLGWLSVCLVCIVFHVCAVSEVAPALGPGEALHVLVWSRKYVCDP